MANRIQIRRDTAANWTNVNPTLSQGEAGLETDTNKLKYGDGVTVWTGLPYLSGSGGGNPFDQTLDTTSSVTFANLNITNTSTSTSLNIGGLNISYLDYDNQRQVIFDSYAVPPGDTETLVIFQGNQPVKFAQGAEIYDMYLDRVHSVYTSTITVDASISVAGDISANTLTVANHLILGTTGTNGNAIVLDIDEEYNSLTVYGGGMTLRGRDDQGNPYPPGSQLRADFVQAAEGDTLTLNSDIVQVNTIKFSDNSTQTTAWLNSPTATIQALDINNGINELSFSYGGTGVGLLGNGGDVTIKNSSGQGIHVQGASGQVYIDSGIVFPDNSVQTTAWSGAYSTSTLSNGSYTAYIDADGNVNANMFLAAEGPNGSTGYSFQNDGGLDTGMFSTGDGLIQFYANAQEVYNFSTSGLQLNKTLDLNGNPILFGNGNAHIQAGMGFHISSEEGISLEAVNIGTTTTYSWYFSPTGEITFPDNTIQTTAYPGGLDLKGNLLNFNTLTNSLSIETITPATSGTTVANSGLDILLMNFNDPATPYNDMTNQALTLNGGGSFSNTETLFGAYSYYNNEQNNGDYISTQGSSIDFTALNSSDFTIDFGLWIDSSGGGWGYQTFVNGDGFGEGPNNIWFGIDNGITSGSGRLKVGQNNGNYASAYNPPVNQWLHIGLMRRSGVYYFLCNGVTEQISGNPGLTFPQDLQFFGGNNQNNWGAGYIANFRVANQAIFPPGTYTLPISSDYDPAGSTLVAGGPGTTTLKGIQVTTATVGAIRFADNTVLTSASPANPFNQSLNTGNDVQFNSIETNDIYDNNGHDLIHFSNGGIVANSKNGYGIQFQTEYTNQLWMENGGAWEYDNGQPTVVVQTQLGFADGTIQTTAWTGTVAMTNITGNLLTFPANVNSTATIDYSQDSGGFFIIKNSYVGGQQSINLDTDDGQVRLSSQNNGGTLYNWDFRGDGNVYTPGNIYLGGNQVRDQNNNGIELSSAVSTSLNHDDVDFVVADSTGITLTTREGVVKVQTNYNNHTWQFNEDGSLTFPDASVQTTAYSPIFAQGRLTTDQSISQGTDTTVTVTADIDPLGLFDTNTVVIATTGTYEVSVSVLWAPNDTGTDTGQINTQIHRNSDQVYLAQNEINNTQPLTQTGSVLINCAPGDNIYATVYTSGTNGQTVSGGNATLLSIRRI